MSTLYLVRHGQASFLSVDYDQLSNNGVEQSRKLGAAWAKRNLHLDALYISPQRRHLQTADAMRAAASVNGMDLPEPIVLEHTSEIELHRLFGEAIERVVPMFPDLPNLLMSQADADDAKTARGHVMGIVSSLMDRWSRGEEGFDQVESFDSFSQRIRSALVDLMREQGRGKKVALVTSGGPISQAAQLALQLTPESTVELMAVLYNGSVTEMRYTEDRLSLVGLNTITHLAPDMLTLI